MAANDKSAKMTPEQEALAQVNEDALASATQSTIGMSHPSNVEAQRHFIEHYLAYVRNQIEEAAAGAARKEPYDASLGRDQRQAKVEMEQRKILEEKERKEWEDKHPEQAKKARESKERDEREQRERDHRERERAERGKNVRDDLGRSDRDTKRDEKK